MTPINTRALQAAGIALVLAVYTTGAFAESHWPAWRGPTADGVAPGGNPPITWSETENIKWKTPLTGTGQSTPVIWGDRIFILTAESTDENADPTRKPDSSEQPRGQGRRLTRGKPDVDYNFNVSCLSLSTGELLWEKTAATATPHEGHHQAGSYAAYSAVTDGEFVWAGFGSRGIYCYSMDGEFQWGNPLLPMTIKSNFGEGSSPVLAGNAVIVVQDHEGPSRISAFEKKTGKLLWEREREERTSWTTPVVAKVAGKLQVIVSAARRIRAYDAETGDIVWKCGGMTRNVIPSPVLGADTVYCASGFFGSSVKAIALGRTGDLTDTDAVSWSLGEASPYVPTPLLLGEHLYLIEDIKPYLSCVDAKTGELLYTRKRLPGLRQIYASPTGAGEHIYIIDRAGTAVVIAPSEDFRILATNSLEDGFDASPVVVGSDLLLKGNQYLYCISNS
jgi:outer membrane protein assembly factor BamB